MQLIGTKHQVEAYIQKVDSYNAYKGDSTITWAEPRKHPNKELYAVAKNPSVEQDGDMEEISELPEDWQMDDPLA